MCSTPVALSCVCPHPRLFFIDSQALKVLKARVDSFPSFPGDHPYATSNPLIKPLYQTFGVCQLEIVYPSANYLVKAIFPKLDSHPVTASCNLSNFVLEI